MTTPAQPDIRWQQRFQNFDRVWVDMMLHRNQLSHTYDFSKFRQVLEAAMDRYGPAMQALHTWLADQARR